MKKLIFKASFLALATLTIFSACKKDEVIEPEFIEKAEIRYTPTGCTVTVDGKKVAGIQCVSGGGKCKYMECRPVGPMPIGPIEEK